jgi:small ligand-binding sensory domain FIST
VRFASHISDAPDLEEAVVEAATSIRLQLGAQAPDLLFVFVSPHHASSFDLLPQLIADQLEGKVFGCSAGGAIGGGIELEQRPALSITAARMPGVTSTIQHLDGHRLPPPTNKAAWRGFLGAPPGTEDAYCVALGDPFSTNAGALLAGLDTITGSGATIGGIASGAKAPGDAALFLEEDVVHEGVALLTLRGNLKIDTIVAQGCRPIGQPMFVTACDRNILVNLDGQPSVDALRALYQASDEQDQALFKQSLFLGMVMDAEREVYEPGDFLIRSLSGMDTERGGLVTGALLRTNQVVQFHLRDAATSAQDLDAHLAAYVRMEGAPPAGALMFSCLGRGERLYGRTNHDSDLMRAHLGDVPIGGFFCNGEFGRVGRRTWLHGYTSSVALFRPLQRTC